MSAFVHVVMPAFNRARYLRQAIDSVRRQTYTQWKLSVVDDGSTDDTFSIAEAAAGADDRIEIIRIERNGGIPRALNLALKETEADYYSFIGSDDVWLPPLLESQVRLASQGSSLGAVACDGWVVNAIGQRTGLRVSDLMPLPHGAPFGSTWAQIVRSHVSTVGILCDHELVKSNAFNERLPRFHDMFAWIQISMHRRIAMNPLPLCEFRIHGDNLTAERPEARVEYVQLADEIEKLVRPRSRYLRWELEQYRFHGHRALGDERAAASSLIRLLCLRPFDRRNVGLSLSMIDQKFHSIVEDRERLRNERSRGMGWLG